MPLEMYTLGLPLERQTLARVNDERPQSDPVAHIHLHNIYEQITQHCQHIDQQSQYHSIAKIKQ